MDRKPWVILSHCLGPRPMLLWALIYISSIIFHVSLCSTLICVFIVSGYCQHCEIVWTLDSRSGWVSASASASDKCFRKHSIHYSFISIGLCKFWCALINNILQTQGNVNTVRLYGPTRTISQSQPQPHTNAIVSNQNTHYV
jgi:hypothetical protein